MSGVESVLFFQFAEETVAVDDVAHVRALADDSVTVFGFHAEREFTPLDCRQHGCGVHCLANGGRAQVRHIDMCPNSRPVLIQADTGRCRNIP